jgi:hypothetical protein
MQYIIDKVYSWWHVAQLIFLSSAKLGSMHSQWMTTLAGHLTWSTESRQVTRIELLTLLDKLEKIAPQIWSCSRARSLPSLARSTPQKVRPRRKVVPSVEAIRKPKNHAKINKMLKKLLKFLLNRMGMDLFISNFFFFYFKVKFWICRANARRSIRGLQLVLRKFQVSTLCARGAGVQPPIASHYLSEASLFHRQGSV